MSRSPTAVATVRVTWDPTEVGDPTMSALYDTVETLPGHVIDEHQAGDEHAIWVHLDDRRDTYGIPVSWNWA